MMRINRPAAVLSSRTAAVAVTVLAAVWLLLLVFSPYLVSRAGAGLETVAGVVYLAGRMVCHQRADRSFHAWGVQLPVCARCVGIYAAAAAGSLFAVATMSGRHAGREDGDQAAPVDWARRLAFGAVPTAASVSLEVVGLWAQSPVIRSVAALPLGFVAGWFVAEHAGQVIARVSAGLPGREPRDRALR